MNFTTSLSRTLLAGAVFGVGFAATPTQAALMVITPVGAGSANPSQAWHHYMVRAFNAQPTWDEVNGIPIGEEHVFEYWGETDNATAYIDFGEDFANIRIHQVWTHYPQFVSVSENVGPVEYWWDDNHDAINDGVTESVLKLRTYPSLATVSDNRPGGAGIWSKDMDLGDSYIIPQGRYLLFRTEDTAGRSNELAFIGRIVPEPASLSLLALAGAAALRRRRAT